MLQLIVKGLRCLRENGFYYTCNKIIQKFKKRKMEKRLADIIQYPMDELERQRRYNNPSVHFSIITPLYNTPPQFLVKSTDYPASALKYGHF